MDPKLSAATNHVTESPELATPLPDSVRTLSPPYSIPYAKALGEKSLPKCCISEWRPSAAEIKILNEGGSVYLISYTEEHPQVRIWAGPEGFPTNN